jgi:hypothetical protein
MWSAIIDFRTLVPNAIKVALKWHVTCDSQKWLLRVLDGYCWVTCVIEKPERAFAEPKGGIEDGSWSAYLVTVGFLNSVISR